MWLNFHQNWRSRLGVLGVPQLYWILVLLVLRGQGQGWVLLDQALTSLMRPTTTSSIQYNWGTHKTPKRRRQF